MTTNTEETTAQAPAEKAKAAKKASVGQKRAHGAPAKAKAAKKAKAPKKAPKGAKKADGARDGSKAASILELLKRPDGATLAELMKATGWQAHRMGHELKSTVNKALADGIRQQRLVSESEGD